MVIVNITQEMGILQCDLFKDGRLKKIISHIDTPKLLVVRPLRLGSPLVLSGSCHLFKKNR